jgi:TAT (twin-arginine translocation) pathway-exported protein
VTITRRDFLKGSAAVAAGAAVAPWDSLASAQTLRRCLWGAYPDPYPGCETGVDGCGPEDYMPKVREFEALIGRKIGMTRHYPRWDYPIPNPVIMESRRTGHVPLISWRPQLLPPSNQWLSWGDIANGVHDDRIREVAAGFVAWDKRAYFVFHLEPENAYRHGHCGTPADFQAAFNHVKQVFQDEGVTKLRYPCTLQRVTYDGSTGGPDAWFPSGATMVGVDGYNRGSCSHDSVWNTFPRLFSSAHDFAVERNKRMVIEEWGCVENDPLDCGFDTGQSKADWLREAGATIKAWGNVNAVIYTHSLAEFHDAPIDFRVDTSDDSLTAYKEVGADPFFN